MVSSCVCAFVCLFAFCNTRVCPLCMYLSVAIRINSHCFSPREKHMADCPSFRRDPAQGGRKNKGARLPLILAVLHSHRIRPNREQGPGEAPTGMWPGGPPSGMEGQSLFLPTQQEWDGPEVGSAGRKHRDTKLGHQEVGEINKGFLWRGGPFDPRMGKRKTISQKSDLVSVTSLVLSRLTQLEP